MRAMRWAWPSWAVNIRLQRLGMAKDQAFLKLWSQPKATPTVRSIRFGLQTVRIKALGWKQAEVAKRLGIAQSNVSALTNYRLDNFSSEKLVAFFYSVGYDVDVLSRPAMPKRRGAMQVLIAV